MNASLKRWKMKFRCSECGAELRPVGHTKEFYQRYVCPNGCKFKRPKLWYLEEIFAIPLTLLMILLITPGVIILKVANIVKRLHKS